MAGLSATSLIGAAGAFDLAFAAFHLAFPLLFRWRSRLAKLDPVNRGILVTLNLMLVFVFAAAGAVLALKPDLVATDALGRGFLFLGAGFWALRAALQPLIFGLDHWASKLLLVVFLAGVTLHAAPAWP
ncbi:hypothetical protein GCM10007036_13530 [Alsobacter metallidurans]|uniref:Uncharacterized protein n=1 Tax=Alsobacter metallidurans TaxID=340221 RepID=A0A917MGD8_9HYPH|nr:hypothetical protein [Alsobacter metallidurans]GGH14310.1 hypothetical protein GCM10007036_13530 [Alsobacter metallidurans]